MAESRRGRRASQVVANMGFAAMIAVGFALWRTPKTVPAGVAILAALCEAAADTVSSEVGQAIGGLPILWTTGARVAAGTDGAISAAGTIAGCMAAGILALIAVPTLALSGTRAMIAWLTGVAGLFFDSVIGATLERANRLNNDLVNFLSTAFAALLALVALLFAH